MEYEPGDVITLSDRKYVVAPDGSWRVLEYLDADEPKDLIEA